jgi:hypothetical protein
LALVLSVLLSFGPCVVCSSVFWPLCCLFFCLLAIVLSVLRFTHSDYPIDIFKLFLIWMFSASLNNISVISVCSKPEYEEKTTNLPYRKSMTNLIT